MDIANLALLYLDDHGFQKTGLAGIFETIGGIIYAKIFYAEIVNRKAKKAQNEIFE